MRIYPGKDDFYHDRGGRYSVELDYGCWHIDDVGIDPATRGKSAVNRQNMTLGNQPVSVMSASASGRYTISLVEDTGDIYAWRYDDQRCALIANIPGTSESRRDTADRLLSGWTEIKPRRGMGRPLSWFVGRLADYLVSPT